MLQQEMKLIEKASSHHQTHCHSPSHRHGRMATTSETAPKASAASTAPVGAPSPSTFPLQTPDPSDPNLSPLVIAIIGILAAFLLVTYYTVASKYCATSGTSPSHSPPAGRLTVPETLAAAVWGSR